MIELKQTRSNCIDNLELFTTLSIEQRSLIFSLVKHEHYKAGESIYSPGEIANSIHIMSRGKARIYRLSENGKEGLIRILIPGDFTGELALFKKGIYEAYAQALEDTSICKIHHDDFKKILQTYPSISIKMLSTLAERLSNSEQQSAWMSTETAKERLMHYLIQSAIMDDKGKLFVYLDMPKRALASYLGTTPETLSRQFTKLKKDGVIRQPSKDVIQLIGITIDDASCKII